jgi:hypothetical protein
MPAADVAVVGLNRRTLTATRRCSRLRCGSHSDRASSRPDLAAGFGWKQSSRASRRAFVEVLSSRHCSTLGRAWRVRSEEYLLGLALRTGL